MYVATFAHAQLRFVYDYKINCVNYIVSSQKTSLDHYAREISPLPLRPTKFKFVSKFCNLYATICMSLEKTFNSSWNVQLSKSGWGRFHVQMALRPPLCPIDYVMVPKCCNFYVTVCMFLEKYFKPLWGTQYLKNLQGGQFYMNLNPSLCLIDFKVVPIFFNLYACLMKTYLKIALVPAIIKKIQGRCDSKFQSPNTQVYTYYIL